MQKVLCVCLISRINLLSLMLFSRWLIVKIVKQLLNRQKVQKKFPNKYKVNLRYLESSRNPFCWVSFLWSFGKPCNFRFPLFSVRWTMNLWNNRSHKWTDVIKSEGRISTKGKGWNSRTSCASKVCNFRSARKSYLEFEREEILSYLGELGNMCQFAVVKLMRFPDFSTDKLLLKHFGDKS